MAARDEVTNQESSRFEPRPAGFHFSLPAPSGADGIDRVVMRFDMQGICDVGLFRKSGENFEKAMGVQHFWPEDIADEIKKATGLELRPSELKALDDMRVASIIIGQFGGKEFLTMTGTHGRCIPIDNGLAILLPDDMEGANRIAKIETKLTLMDDYTSTYFRKGSDGWEVVAESKHLFFDDLQRNFREKTGLATRFPVVFVRPAASQGFQAWN
jgi:hypothetical protein